MILSVIGVPGAILAGWMVDLPYIGRYAMPLLNSLPLCITDTIKLTYADPWNQERNFGYFYTFNRRLSILWNDSKDLECLTGLELRIYFHFQRDVWSALRNYSRALSYQR